ncbi:MAG: winged helix-turn-helix domain-containing protein [Acetobacteraceae bacterium]
MPERGRGQVYSSGRWEADLDRRELRADGVPIPLGFRAFEIVEVLVRSAGALVSKSELMERVWPGASVEENTLQVHISALRKALGADRGLLKTASGRGYRLTGDWSRQEVISTSSDGVDPAVAPDGWSASNLPLSGVDLIGRAAAVQYVGNLLSAYRAVTLTGPGGIGKTRLALEVARAALPAFHGAGWLVELAPLSDPGLVPSAVARIIGLRLSGDEASAESVARAIGARQFLLVFDNCEHVVDAAAAMAEAIVRLCPRATVLTTSREILRIDGEQIYRVAPLDVPSSDQSESDELLRCSASALFLARMRASNSAFVPDGSDVSAIATICRKLDGIPLAIEFAAARAATLGVAQVASALNDRFGLLVSGRRTALPRHQTLRATFDWSYDLLPEGEAAMLCRLAVFAGHFTLDAVTAVIDDLPEHRLLDGIANLVAKSLIVAELRNGTASYRLLDTIRHYGLEKLRDRGELRQVARRHADYCLTLCVRAEAESETRTDAEWLAVYAGHLDNMRAAVEWGFSPDGDTEIGVALTVGIVPFWFRLSLMKECRGRIEQALAAAGAETDARVIMRLRAALAAALLYSEKGATPEVAEAWANVLAIAERLDDGEHRLWARWGLWNHRLNHGAFQESLLMAQRFSDVATNPGDLAIGDRMAGISLHFLGEQAAARQHLESVLRRRYEAAPRSRMIRLQYDQKLAARAYLPRILWLQGFPDQAMRAAHRVVRDALADGHALSICLALSQAACSVALLAGDVAAADRFVAMLRERAAAYALDLWRAEGRCHEGILRVMRGDVAVGLRMFRAGADELLDTNTGMNHAGFLIGMAGALIVAGDCTQALVLVSGMLARSDRAEERWFRPELLRLSGECRLCAGELEAAEASFRQSLDCAQRQETPSWALRTAIGLAGLLRTTGRAEEARTVLGHVLGQFTEGFETADLRRGRSLIGLTQVE